MGDRRRLHLDFETASEVDIRKVTTPVYTSHPSTRILMLGWAFDDDPVQVWEPHRGDAPAELIQGLNSDATLHAANAAFERGLILHKMGIHTGVSRWRDTLVEGYALGFAGGLDAILSATGLRTKDPRGGRLIAMFCSPAPKNHKVDWYTYDNRPGEWEEFKSYCKQDVEVERDLCLWCMGYGGMSAYEWDLYAMDQEINGIGIPIDAHMAEGAVKLWERELARVKLKLSEITGISPTTRNPFLKWLSEKGLDLPDTTKETVSAAITSNVTPEVTEALILWGQQSTRATDKYKAVLLSNQGGRLHGVFQFAGASRTRRWAGRKFQPHNLKQSVLEPEQVDVAAAVITNGDIPPSCFWPDQSVADFLGTSIRHVICAPDGHSLAVADLSSIESRVIGWLTHCKAMNHVFETGKDTYVDFASRHFGVRYEDVTPSQRKFSKPPVLGAGFGLGYRGLIAYAKGYGVLMSEEEATRAVDTFRGVYCEIPAFWKWLDTSIKYVIQSKMPVIGNRLAISMDGDFLTIKLPSNRKLFYYQPRVTMRYTPWGSEAPTVSYMGTGDNTQWARIYVHPGLFTENIVQAIARDLLAYGMKLAHDMGLKVVSHVHDEVVVETPAFMADATLRALIRCLETRPPWAKALILKAAGYTSKRYRKD